MVHYIQNMKNVKTNTKGLINETYAKRLKTIVEQTIL